MKTTNELVKETLKDATLYDILYGYDVDYTINEYITIVGVAARYLAKNAKSKMLVNCANNVLERIADHNENYIPFDIIGNDSYRTFRLENYNLELRIRLLITMSDAEQHGIDIDNDKSGRFYL